MLVVGLNLHEMLSGVLVGFVVSHFEQGRAGTEHTGIVTPADNRPSAIRQIRTDVRTLRPAPLPHEGPGLRQLSLASP